MSVYTDRPWLQLYDDDLSGDIAPEFETMLELWRSSVERAPDRPLIHYFHSTLTVAEVDRLTDALAVGLAELGIRRGDRVALYLQNVPQFVLAMLAGFKAAAIMVSINPMLRGRELGLLLNDSGARALVTLESLHRDVASAVLPETDVELVVTTSELDFLDRPPGLLERVVRHRAEGTHDLLELARRHDGRTPAPAALGADDVAFLTYTSGTTGPPKGAMNTHRNVVFNSQTYRDWMRLGEGDSILAVAPLFHITGLIGHVGLGLLLPAPIVLGYRFDPRTTVELIRHWRPTFTIAAITVFIALMNEQSLEPGDLESLRKVYSGGAPIPPATADAWERRFGTWIHNAYGLTETTSPSHATPLERRSPVDARTGALSVGTPTFNTIVKVIGDDGNELPPGEIGEFVTSGPQVVPGYWGKPEETAHAIPDGELHTGDVGFMDDEGWFYIVDRKKDQINAAGYKVWPREVEDILYEHPAVREAAVVGAPDEYRGETVKAFVSLKPGQTAEPAEIIAFCKERMAAYKYPRQVELIDELPKTVTGKVLRRELRERTATEAAATGRPSSGGASGP